MDTTNHSMKHIQLTPRRSLVAPRRAFTLVELLVVITIIGILASLITVAAVGALKKARQTQIKVELDQISGGFDEYKNKTTAYPPNCQTDGTGSTATAPIDETAVLNDIKRHLKQAFPRHQEPDEVIFKLAGLATTGAPLPSGQGLQGGMTAGEAVVFWLGGFSQDPKYPISGEGGPSYSIASKGNATNGNDDPIESRKWVYPFDVSRLVPRNTDGYFDVADGRFIEYTDAKGAFRRINFWQYTPSKSEQPYLYFDTSRHPAYDATATQPSRFDPPAATANGGVHVHAFKKLNPSWTTTSPASVAPITFINPDKFQVMHCGIDGVWDSEELFEKMTAHKVPTPDKPDNYLLFPTGPFIGDIADTVVNFATGTKIEDAQK